MLETSSKDDKNISVRWYDGRYTRWKPSRERKDGAYVPWIDSISGSQVIVNFTVPTIETFKLIINTSVKNISKNVK